MFLEFVLINPLLHVYHYIKIYVVRLCVTEGHQK